MSIFCLGVNHKTAPVEIRERLAFSEQGLGDHLREIVKIDSINETVVLSTCNRVEIYGASNQCGHAMDQVRDFLIDHFDIAGHAIDFYHLEAEAAANHIFEVAGGLDSMVLGETEIFGQVKKAYRMAHEAGTTARYLNKLFQQSFTIGKLIRSNSKIQHGSTSIGSVAVDLAEKIFGNLKGCQVMIIGAGEMSRTTAQSMISRGASGIIVSNRSFDKAQELAEELAGKAIRFDDWETVMPHVNIVISSTSASHPIIKQADISHQMKNRRGRPIFLIDIAVPRDIEDDIRWIDNAFLYNIDQLTEIAEAGKSRREEQIIFCRKLIADHISEKGIDALKKKTITDSSGDQPPMGNQSPLTNP